MLVKLKRHLLLGPVGIGQMRPVPDPVLQVDAGQGAFCRGGYGTWDDRGSDSFEDNAEEGGFEGDGEVWAGFGEDSRELGCSCGGDGRCENGSESGRRQNYLSKSKAGLMVTSRSSEDSKP